MDIDASEHLSKSLETTIDPDAPSYPKKDASKNSISRSRSQSLIINEVIKHAGSQTTASILKQKSDGKTTAVTDTCRGTPTSNGEIKLA